MKVGTIGFAAAALAAAGGLALTIAARFTAAAPDYGSIIPRSMAASVQLFSERDGGARRSASGVVLAVDGDGSALILTAGHFLAPAVPQSVTVATPGSNDRRPAEILLLDDEADLALLRARDTGTTSVEMQSAARLGDAVWVISFPWGRRGTLASGVVSQVADDNEDAFPLDGPVGLIDAAVGYGTSGAGVFDAHTGRLVGIVRGYRTARLAIPGTSDQSLEFPIAGETTVVPTTTIICALRRADLGGDVAALLPPTAPAEANCTDT